MNFILSELYAIAYRLVSFVRTVMAYNNNDQLFTIVSSTTVL